MAVPTTHTLCSRPRRYGALQYGIVFVHIFIYSSIMIVIPRLLINLFFIYFYTCMYTYVRVVQKQVLVQPLKKSWERPSAEERHAKVTTSRLRVARRRMIASSRPQSRLQRRLISRTCPIATPYTKTSLVHCLIFCSAGTLGSSCFPWDLDILAT